ncbi:signal transducer and activator of transcription 1-like isoform X2 [Brachyhypopomus gauderio]|uniref:signal transducer and activator of transcription 1-like isoform X2 n=1 Tax=Brachyhypopomus gauderio TaxID=698409 RepID=UPI00404389D0
MWNYIFQEAEQVIQDLEDQQDEPNCKRKTLQSQVQAETNAQTAQDESQQETMMVVHVKQHREIEIIATELAQVLMLVDQIQFSLISVELPEWKQKQQMACIGGPPNACLDQLQSWFTTVAECLQQTRQQLNKLQELVVFSYDNDPIAVSVSTLQEQALALFTNLLTNSIVVERQPCMPIHPQRPLVLKMGVQFTVKLRMLVFLPEFSRQLKVQACFDKDLTEKNTNHGYRRFKILGSTTKLMEESDGSLTAEFRHLTLREQITAGDILNKSRLLIVEQLHLLNFDIHLNHPGLSIDLMTTTLPLVVITPMTQLSQAWAAVLWYNMHCTDCQNVIFFLDPPPLTWGQVVSVLSWQFSGFTQRGLDADQLSMLADRLLGPEAQGNPETLVSWSKFSKPDAGRLSFWSWIDNTQTLIRRYLLNIWNDGYIMGFITEEKAKTLLVDKCPGTFLLRFSETCFSGGIIITWVEQCQTGELQTHSTKSYSNADLNTVSLPDIIQNYTVMAVENILESPLHYLYPDIPKDAAFGCYYSSLPKEGTLHS